jgi:hypothetical protein
MTDAIQDCSRRLLLGRLAIFATLLMPSFTRAAAPPGTRPAEQDFLRFEDDHKGGGTLQTAIATYRNADGVEVHLVAAVHVGEPAYFRDLAKTFDGYDAVLYELVKPKDATLPGAKPAAAAAEGAEERKSLPKIRGGAAVGGLQSFMKNALKLDFQLDAIDYTKPNFVHADLDVETFNKLQAERGESIFGLMLRSIVREMTREHAEGESDGPSIFEILAAMKSPDSARQYKLLLARQFGEMERQIEGMDGESGSVLIAERNKVALKVLRQTIAQGKRAIGVFYGAGHMRGIEKELVETLGFKRTGVEWRVAWDMRAKK